jgi:TonB family protein
MSAEDIFSTAKKRNDNYAFFVILALLFFLLFSGISYLSTIEALPVEIQEKLSTLKTSFSIVQEKKKEPPIDLGEKPKVAKSVEELPKEVTQTTQQQREVQRVFGVQRVYSTGLGSGGAMSGAVVGKFGNTIDKDFDTITAAKSDLVGEVVATANITQAPAFKRRVRPVITDEIRASGISGTVRVRVLVDIDGKVKKAVAQDDLGFGTKESAIEACLQMEFSPAMRGDEAVAVWITVPVRFEKL